MKRFLSIAMAVVMITGILLSFPLSSFAYEPPYAGPPYYSGGSGTENDPYLISSYEDIKSLRIFVSNDREPYSHKTYYKLTKNITVTGGPISPIYKDSECGVNCYVESKYDCSDISKMFSNDQNDAETEKRFEELKNTVGFLSSHTSQTYRNGNPNYSERYDEYTDAADLRLGAAYMAHDGSDVLTDVDNVFYRKAVFTGVFDGNGYTITLNGSYLFGFLDGGAKIKNLTLSGSDASLAFSVSESCKISNCKITADSSFTDYCSEGTFSLYYEYPYNEWIGFTDYSIYGGAIAVNYGTVENCVNYADGICGLIGYNYAPEKTRNCANYGDIYTDYADVISNKTLVQLLSNDYKTRSSLEWWYVYDGEIYLDWYEEDYEGEITIEYVPATGLLVDALKKPEARGINGGTACVDYANHGSPVSGDGYFTINECEDANGNVNVYINEGFDFENDWVMISGYPILRSACRANAGDLNVDGAVNIVDSNLMKRHLTGAQGSASFIFLGGADINLDGEINPADSYLLKRMLVG